MPEKLWPDPTAFTRSERAAAAVTARRTASTDAGRSTRTGRTC
jgi:hypothetical protein